MDTSAKITVSPEEEVYPEIAGGNEVNKNEQMQLMIRLGEIRFNKSHFLAVSPGGFKLSAYLQEQMCRTGTELVSEEGEEALNGLLETGTNARETERLRHHCGEHLNQMNGREVYSDSVQLRVPFNRQLYILMDSKILLKRDTNRSWKGFKLCRMFYNTYRVASVSGDRNVITESRYVAVGYEGFSDKLPDVIPPGYPLVFIADGAKWIEDYYPENTRILDFYHCKEHIYSFVKEYFTEIEALRRVEDGIDELRTGAVDDFLKELEVENKGLLKSKNKLLAYLINNKERINYVKLIKKRLLTGSGAIESAHRNVIQKRMKLSGQCRTIQEAKQLPNLRTPHKIANQQLIRKQIVDNRNNA
jgi:hypothetical protein